MVIKVYSTMDVVAEIDVVGVVVGVGVVKIDLIDNHVRFSTYHRLDFDHQS